MKKFVADRRKISLGLASGVTLLAAGIAPTQAQDAPQAQTRFGKVRGFKRNGAAVFLGIPYGAPTDGERRFMPPAPPAAWTDVRDATRLGQRAPQPPDTLYGSPLYGPWLTGGRAQELIAMNEPMGEDCLVLNVLTPQTDNRGRPVMVYLHGGGYTSNSGAINSLGDRFAVEQDTVLVTVNHRLGALGFLYLGGISPRYAEGNPSLLDLVAALQWVRDNIANFGGDPAKVTIFGDSGGGGKVGMLLAMPQAKGLFRAAIMESSANVATDTADAATQAARGFLEKLSVPASDLSALHKLPASSFVGVGAQNNPLWPGPVMDGRTLPSPMWTKGAPASAANIPLIIGSCADEEAIFSGMRNRDLFTIDWPQIPVRLAQITQKPQAAIEPCVTAYRAAYPKEGPVDICLRMLSLTGFGLGRNGRDIADIKAAQPAPVYYYRNEFDTRIPPGIRAFHTSELPLAMRLVADPRAEGLSKLVSGAWAAFARTGGDPNHAGMPRWERYSANGAPVMVFNETTRLLRSDPEAPAQNMFRAVLKS